MPLQRPARNHLFVAGERPQLGAFSQMDGARSPVRSELVLVARSSDSGQNHPGSSAGVWRCLIDASPAICFLPFSSEFRRLDISHSQIFPGMSETITGSAFPSKPSESSALPVSNPPTLTTREKQRILVEWNQTACDYPRDKCLHELIEMQAQRLPDGIAVACESRQLSYREFNSSANQLAHYLRSRGVGPHIRVGICLEPSLDFAVATLAVLKSGAACVPFDPKYPKERLAYMLRDVQVQVLITQPEILPGEVPAGCEVLLLQAQADVLGGQPRTNPGSSAAPDDIAYVIYTSGSTGQPRGVLLPHAGLVNYAANMSRVYAMSPDDRVLQFCSISFDIALEEMFITWLSGATLVLRSE